MELWDHQKEALEKLKNGSVLVGGTGSGKTLTSLVYFKRVLEASRIASKALYVITTAKKRDDGDWMRTAHSIGLRGEIYVDSWNNIKKYIKVRDSMFIFDEQRVVGYGVWSKAFIRIAKRNHWILLSATPADTWMDLVPVFIANGFFRNKTEFVRHHVIFAPYVTYPKITGYRYEEILERYKDQIFVTMDFERHTKQHISEVLVDYNDIMLKTLLKTQWNPFTDLPVETLPEEIFAARQIINSHPSRIFALLDLHETVKKLIIFYNFNFERDIIRNWFDYRTVIGERSGRRHDDLPDGDDWIYLVQYNSGSEAWECFTTNHIAYYSLNYSYRTMHQSRGRIERHNTPYKDLYYWELVSDSFIDKAIQDALKQKKDFNINTLNIDKYR